MSHLGYLAGEQSHLGDLLIMVVNHLPSRMILQILPEVNGALGMFLGVKSYLLNTFSGGVWVSRERH